MAGLAGWLLFTPIKHGPKFAALQPDENTEPSPAGSSSDGGVFLCGGQCDESTLCGDNVWSDVVRSKVKVNGSHSAANRRTTWGAALTSFVARSDP